MTAIEWLVVAVGALLIGAVNWWFFSVGDAGGSGRG